MADGGGRDLKRAVAFLTLDKVQRAPEAARDAFLSGKGFTAEEIAEAKRQAEEVLRKRREDSSSSSSSSSSTSTGTFGGSSGSSTSAALPWALARDFEPGQKSSKRVTVGGLSFISLSTPIDGDGDAEAAARVLLGKLDGALASSAGAGGGIATKADVAVVFVSAKAGAGAGAGGASEAEAAVHRALDAWTDGEQPPVRHVVVASSSSVGEAGELQLMAVARAR